jgi:hypothetical protein
MIGGKVGADTAASRPAANDDGAVSFLYCIAANDAGEAGPSKLGLARDMERRVRQLQTGHPQRLKVWACREVRADRVRYLEWALHAHPALRRVRMVGEWFSIAPAGAIAELELLLIHCDQDDLRRVGGAGYAGRDY